MYSNLSPVERKTYQVTISSKRDANEALSIVEQLCNDHNISFKRSTLTNCLAEAFQKKYFEDLYKSPSKYSLLEFCQVMSAKLSEKQHKLKDVKSFDERLFNMLFDSTLRSREMKYIKSKGKSPLYEWCNRNMRAFPSYLFIDIKTCDVYWSMSEFGYSPPRAFWGIERMYDLNYEIKEMSGAELNQFIKEIQPDIDKLLNNSRIDWDGSNFVAHLNNNAVEAEQSIKSALM